MREVHVALRPHWLNGWFLVLFTSPRIVVGSTEHRARWGRAVTIPVAAGQRVGAGIRYFGRGRLLGVEDVELDDTVPAGSTLLFRNGPWNHDPFRLVRVGRSGA